MVTIQISKDIREYEPKFAGPLTQRQFVGLFIGAVIFFSVGAIEKSIFGSAPNTYLIPLIPSLIPIAWASIKSDIPPEKYIRYVLIPSLIVPRNRIYRTHNFFDAAFEPQEEPGNEKNEKDKKKQPPLRSIPEELREYK